MAGEPVGQPRAWKLKTMTIEAPDKSPVHGWKAMVHHEASRAMATTGLPPIEGPVLMDMLVNIPRPKALRPRSGDFAAGPGLYSYLPCDKKPDLDNLWKAVQDALKGAGVWYDDKQVCHGALDKAYAPADQQPGVYVAVWEIVNWAGKAAPKVPRKKKPAGTGKSGGSSLAG